jgi:tRNA A-37 threonylcarbamoyl transferase component Bud32
VSPSIRWLGGAAETRAAVARFLDAPPSEVVDGYGILRTNERRCIARIRSDDAKDLLLKQFRVGSGLHPWRERLRAWAGRGSGDHEWRALQALSRAGMPVPRPLAHGVLSNGDRLLVLEHLGGRSLADALADGPRARRKLLAGLGSAVAAIHASGHIHGDLHHGNVLVTPAGPVLLDLQQARAATGLAARARDLAHLDHSLAPLLSTPDRVRLRAAALSLALPFSAEARAQLRLVGELSRERARHHAASRRRHASRPGRAFVVASLAGARGLRVRELSDEVLARALRAHTEAVAAGDARVIEDDDRASLCGLEVDQHRMVSKEVRTRSLGRAVADLFRGSSARRAWLGGHGLQILAVGAATPLAYLEWRRLGCPVRSLVLLEDLRPDEGAHRVLETAVPATRIAALDALLDLVLRLHRAGADHGDLKASHVLLRPAGARFEARLIDLDGVRFRAQLSDAERVRSLAQLNASVGDALEPALREGFFARYAQALRFAAGARLAREAVVRESLARKHRWTGQGCGMTSTPEISND